MNCTNPHPDGGDESKAFDDASRADLWLETTLHKRAIALRTREGLTARVTQSTQFLFANGARQRRSRLDGRKARWGMGVAIAASLAGALMVMNVLEENHKMPHDRSGPIDQIVSSADQGGAVSEPVLVSLLGGSDAVLDGGDPHLWLDDRSAMPLLRLRDASFGDLDAEVQLILASAGQQ